MFLLLIKIYVLFLLQDLPELIDAEVLNWLVVMEHFIHCKFVNIFMTWSFRFSLELWNF